MSLGTGAAKAGRCCLHKVSQGFKKSERLKKALSFKKVFKEGRYLKGRCFSLRVLENNLTISRLGISVQAKLFPKATQRNRIKRLLREAFRRNKYRLDKGYDIIIRPKPLFLTRAGYSEVEDCILELLGIAGMLKILQPPSAASE